MARRRQIYEGKAKILYEGPEPGTLIQYFKDDATAFNAHVRDCRDGLAKAVSRGVDVAESLSLCGRRAMVASVRLGRARI